MTKSAYIIVIVSLFFLSCKPQSGYQESPFTIKSANYFFFEDAQQGKKGMQIVVIGETSTSNLSFSKIYFQNKVFEVVPVITGTRFTLTGNEVTLISPDLTLSGNAKDEFGNEPNMPKKIPFELKSEEALVAYSVNGETRYHKIDQVIQKPSVIK